MREQYFLWVLLFCLVAACQNGVDSSDHSKDQTVQPAGDLPEMSIYHLPGVWTNQDSTSFELEHLRGKVTVMVMIYTSCQAACPRLVADMRHIDQQIPAEYADQVQYVLVSIDPETDTPSRMKTFAAENQMTDDRWIFIRSTEDNTREFASVLAVNYKRISPIDFSHSNIISVFDRDGEMVFQQEGLAVSHTKTVQTITDLVHQALH